MAKSTHLGDFGTPRPAYTQTFGWFGRTIRVHPNLTDLGMVDFLRAARDLDETDVEAAMSLVLGQLEGLVHPGDWDVFFTAAKANRQTYQDLMTLQKGLVEALTGRPTGRPADSSGGPTTRPRKSKRRSSSVVKHQLEAAGRPDLAQVVDMARRAGAQQAS